MNLIEIYTSGSSDDIRVFSLLFIFYAIAAAALFFGSVKITKLNITVRRLVLGLFVFYIGCLIVFELSFESLKYIGKRMLASGPGAGLLLLLIELAFGGTIVFAAVQKLIFKQQNTTILTLGFIVAQPILAIVFFVLLMLVDSR